MLAIDPLKGLKQKKPRPTPQPCWTYEQMQQIFAASPEEIRPALLLLGETGMRYGEMAWLTWDELDLKANVLRVQPKGRRPIKDCMRGRKAAMARNAIQHKTSTLARRPIMDVTQSESGSLVATRSDTISGEEGIR